MCVCVYMLLVRYMCYSLHINMIDFDNFNRNSPTKKHSNDNDTKTQ